MSNPDKSDPTQYLKSGKQGLSQEDSAPQKPQLRPEPPRLRERNQPDPRTDTT